jgi:hypothetical protein
MARFMRAIQLFSEKKMDGPDKPGHDELVYRLMPPFSIFWIFSP